MNWISVKDSLPDWDLCDPWTFILICMNDAGHLMYEIQPIDERVFEKEFVTHWCYITEPSE